MNKLPEQVSHAPGKDSTECNAWCRDGVHAITVFSNQTDREQLRLGFQAAFAYWDCDLIDLMPAELLPPAGEFTWHNEFGKAERRPADGDPWIALVRPRPVQGADLI